MSVDGNSLAPDPSVNPSETAPFKSPAAFELTEEMKALFSQDVASAIQLLQALASSPTNSRSDDSHGGTALRPGDQLPQTREADVLRSYHKSEKGSAKKLDSVEGRGKGEERQIIIDVPTPSEYPDGGEPAEYPDRGEPAEYPDRGEPAEYPDGGEPAEYPDRGEPAEYPDRGEPAEYPDRGEPAEYPDRGESAKHPDMEESADCKGITGLATYYMNETELSFLRRQVSTAVKDTYERAVRRNDSSALECLRPLVQALVTPLELHSGRDRFIDIMLKLVLEQQFGENILKAVMKAGANPNALVRGRTMFRAIQDGRCDVIKGLVRLGASIDCSDPVTGKTVLHEAAASGTGHVIDCLIDRGLDIEAADRIHGNRPFHYACTFANRDAALMLYKKGAEINVVNHVGDTPLAKLLRPLSKWADAFSYRRLELATELVFWGCFVPEHFQAKKYIVIGERNKKRKQNAQRFHISNAVNNNNNNNNNGSSSSSNNNNNSNNGNSNNNNNNNSINSNSSNNSINKNNKNNSNNNNKNNNSATSSSIALNSNRNTTSANNDSTESRYSGSRAFQTHEAMIDYGNTSADKLYSDVFPNTGAGYNNSSNRNNSNDSDSSDDDSNSSSCVGSGSSGRSSYVSSGSSGRSSCVSSGSSGRSSRKGYCQPPHTVTVVFPTKENKIYERYTRLLQSVRQRLSLQQQCRLVVIHALGATPLKEGVTQLGLPRLLQRYVQHGDEYVNS